jgi:hypothetical protein
VPDRRLDVIDYLNLNQLAWQELGNTGCPSDAIKNHKFAVCATVNFEQWHPRCGGPIPRDLPLQFEWICT